MQRPGWILRGSPLKGSASFPFPRREAAGRPQPAPFLRSAAPTFRHQAGPASFGVFIGVLRLIVIDGYRDYEKRRDKSYRWYMATTDSLSYYNYDLCYTEDEKQQYAPDANEEDIFHEIVTTSNKYLKMNWGYDGYGDSGYYSFVGSSWPTGNNPYPYFPWIVYDFRAYGDEE